MMHSRFETFNESSSLATVEQFSHSDARCLKDIVFPVSRESETGHFELVANQSAHYALNCLEEVPCRVLCGGLVAALRCMHRHRQGKVYVTDCVTLCKSGDRLAR